MRNNITCAILVLLSFAGFAQQPTAELQQYQSRTNKFYWKNRTPIPGYWQQDVHYKMNVVVDDKEESIGGTEQLTYWNNSDDELTRLYFHLYQNAFTPNSYLKNMRDADKIKSVFGEHERKGVNTVINSLSINGKAMTYTIDNSILYVDLDEPLLPNSGLTIDINFKTFWDKDDGGNIRRRMKTFRHGGANDNTFLHFRWGALVSKNLGI